MLSDLQLLSGNDIPFPAAQITIHQPTIKEIGLIGEEEFFTGQQILTFSKDILTEEDKMNLEDKTNFDILIAILRERNAVMQKNRNCVEMVLALIFPWYTINISNDGIVLEKEEERHLINNDNFEAFKVIFNSMFSKLYKPSFLMISSFLFFWTFFSIEILLLWILRKEFELHKTERL